MGAWWRPRWLAAATLCAALLLWSGWGRYQARADEQQRQRGAALFHGERPLVARLQGHAQALPAIAGRCSNCHEALDSAPASGSVASGADKARRPYAGVIRGDALLTLRSRRGGPPSAYDEARFCELLRNGIDSAQVMIPNTMPRYESTSADCADLWAFLQHAPD